MTPQEQAALDTYLTTPPEEFYAETYDDTENWNMDDFGNRIYEYDWVFVMYFNINNEIKKFVGSQEGFMTALDEYGNENIITEKLEIISGKEWLNR